MMTSIHTSACLVGFLSLPDEEFSSPAAWELLRDSGVALCEISSCHGCASGESAEHTVPQTLPRRPREALAKRSILRRAARRRPVREASWPRVPCCQVPLKSLSPPEPIRPPPPLADGAPTSRPEERAEVPISTKVYPTGLLRKVPTDLPSCYPPPAAVGVLR